MRCFDSAFDNYLDDPVFERVQLNKNDLSLAGSTKPVAPLQSLTMKKRVKSTANTASAGSSSATVLRSCLLSAAYSPTVTNKVFHQCNVCYISAQIVMFISRIMHKLWRQNFTQYKVCIRMMNPF